MKQYLKLRYNSVINVSRISCLQCTTQFRIEQFTAVTREVVGNEGKSTSGNLERYTGYPIIDDF